jgi:hypothetical protein
MKQVLEKLTAAHLFKKSSYFIVPKVSVLYCQNSATGTYPEPGETSQRSHNLFISEISVNAILLSMPPSPSGISCLGVQTQILYAYLIVGNWRKSRINNYKSADNLPMRTKLGENIPW